MYMSEYKGVYFVEGTPAEAQVVEQLSTELNGFFAQDQLKSLDDLKEKMFAYAQKHGCNCIIDFKYGQQSSFWKSIIGWDDVRWYASGKIARIEPGELEKYRRV